MSSETLRFNAYRQRRNEPGLKTLAGLVLIGVGGFGLADGTVLPSHGLRLHLTALFISGMGGLVWLLIHRLPGFVRPRVDGFSLTLSLLLACFTTYASWLYVGHSTALSVAVVIVFVGIPQLFTWSNTRALVFYGSCFVFHQSPWLFGGLSSIVPDNQIFTQAILLTIIALCLLTNRSRLIAIEAGFGDSASVAQNQAKQQQDLGEMRDLDRLKSGFFASIAESLRGPLTLMISPLDSMLSGDVGTLQANQIEYIETVRRSAMSVLGLTDDLVDLTHLEGGLLRLQTERTDVVGILQGIVDHAHGSAQTKGIEMSFHPGEAEVQLHVDVEKFERAMTHIVATALGCTTSGGRVDLRITPTTGGAEIVVRDNGGGLPPDWLEGFNNQPGGGRWLPPRSPDGVGLVLAREILLLHEAEIELSSRPETGTTFTIRMPAGRRGQHVHTPTDARAARMRTTEDYRFQALNEATATTNVEHAPSESKATKVLVVDDNPEILRFTRRLLAKDHAVFVAPDGEAGLALAAEELPDVIITDTDMPKLDGLGLIRALRASPKTAQIPTIILTARNEPGDREAARESGADMVLDKPFNPRELRHAIQELFAKAHRTASSFMNEQARSFEIISAGLAHEMHNPLAYIKNANFVIGESSTKIANASADGELSLEERTQIIEKAKGKIEKMIPIANRGIQRVEQLVDLMRRYAREGYSSDSVEMGVDDAVRTVLDLIAPKGDADVAIEPDLQAPDAIIRGVPEELQQAITNLTQNAIDAVGKGGHVWVRSRVESRSVRIEIADDGPGIPREQLARIFTPFFTTKEVGKGMGLGLTITRQVIKQHDGELDVDSTPGEGTTFTIRLPLAGALTEDAGTSALEAAAAPPEEAENADEIQPR